MRKMLPGQRLEERVIAGVKISEPELRRLYDLQYEKAVVTGALLPLDVTPIDSTRLNSRRPEGLLRSAQGRVHRPGPGAGRAGLDPPHRRRGRGQDGEKEAEDIVAWPAAAATSPTLARERSEGPYAERGGDLGADVPLSRLPPQLQTAFATLPVGAVTDPIKDGPTYFIFKLNDRKVVGTEPVVRMSQIQVPDPPVAGIARPRSRPDRQAAQGSRLRQAGRGRRQAPDRLDELGLVRRERVRPDAHPDAADPALGLSAKKGEVSRAFANESGWIVAQVTDRREAGPRPFESVRDDVRRELEQSLRQAKPLAAAERIVAAVKGGQPFEAAAAANGAVVFTTQPFPRTTPDPRLTAAPRAVGLAFGLAPGPGRPARGLEQRRAGDPQGFRAAGLGRAVRLAARLAQPDDAVDAAAPLRLGVGAEDGRGAEGHRQAPRRSRS
jgi:hypothetical protein